MTTLLIMLAMAAAAADASQRDRVDSFRSKLQMRIRKKQLLEDIKRRLNQTSRQILAPGSKNLRSKNGLPGVADQVAPIAEHISHSERTVGPSSSVPVVEAAPPLPRSSFQNFKTRSQSMITALSASK